MLRIVLNYLLFSFPVYGHGYYEVICREMTGFRLMYLVIVHEVCGSVK